MFSRDVNAGLKFLFKYKFREIFTAIKMNAMTEASKLMSGDELDIRKGPNLKMQFRHAL